MYLSRNPFTPKENDCFTPTQYLERSLAFARWDRNNRLECPKICYSRDRRILNSFDMCCLNALKNRLEWTLLELAGCQAGIWREPAGFQNWLAYAWKRLDELDAGADHHFLWTKTLTSRDEEINGWIENTPTSHRPGFTLERFKIACQKYGFQPNLELVAFCFSVNFHKLKLYWK